MSPTSANHASGDAPHSVNPPLMDLVALLRHHGFMVTTDDYVHLFKIIERYGAESPRSLALRIAPIIATTPEEQERFYHVFAEYSRQQAALGTTVQPAKGSLKKKLALLIVAGVAIATIVFLALPPSLELPQPGFYSFQHAIDSDYVDDLPASGIFRGHETDTQHVSAEWVDMGSGQKLGSGLRLRHHFREPGMHRIRRTLISGKYRLKNAVAEQQVFVCRALASIQIQAPDSTLKIGEPLQLTALPLQGADYIKGYRWDTGGLGASSIVSGQDSSTLNIRFNNPGLYTIKCAPVVNRLDESCINTASISIQVIDTGKQYEVSLVNSGKPFKPVESLNRLTDAVAVGLIVILAFWGYRKRKEPLKQELPATSENRFQPLASGVAALKPPFEVPFPRTSDSDLVIDRPLRRFLQQLRFKAAEELLVPDLPKSIRSTIRSAGMTELIFSPRKRVQEYLLFIDAAQPQGMAYAFWLHLATLMEREGIPLTRYFYDSNFQCSTSPDAPKVSLRTIADNSPFAIPIILGTGDALLLPYAAVLRVDILEQLQRWDRAILITQTDRQQWTAKESSLSQHLLVAPADASALMRLGQNFRTGRADRWKSATENPNDAPEWTTTDGLRSYLGNDEALFQWLCALFIYPKPRWELLTAFGKTVLARYGRAGDLTYDNLLLFCRIPWMANGSFPQRLRMEMLKLLSTENEIAARESLVSLMRQVTTRYSGDYIFSAEQRLQETISSFVLYSHDPQTFAGHSGAVDAYRQLAEKGQLTDVPARKYLEKAGDTPLRIAGKPASADDVLLHELQKTDTQKKNEQRSKLQRLLSKSILASLMIGAIASTWIWLHNSDLPANISATSWLYQLDSNQAVPVNYRLTRDFTACNDSHEHFSVMPATLLVSGKPVGLHFDPANQTLSTLSVSFRDFVSASPQLTLGIAASAIKTINLDPDFPSGDISIRCSLDDTQPGVREPAMDSATPGQLPAFLNEIWQGRSNNRLLSIDLSNSLLYYSTGGTETWGTYRILRVLLYPDGAYRVVVDAAPRYAVFKLASVQSQGFQLTYCDTRYNTIDEAVKATPDCSNTDLMTVYYPRDKDKVYLPAGLNGAKSSLTRSELGKLERILASATTSSSSALTVRYTYWHNSKSPGKASLPDSYLKRILSQSNKSIRQVQRQNDRLINPSGPFAREYLSIEAEAEASAETSPPNTQRSGYPRLIGPDSLKKLIERNKKGDGEDPKSEKKY